MGVGEDDGVDGAVSELVFHGEPVPAGGGVDDDGFSPPPGVWM